ncbi:hypothetical protein XELAEV_18016758mg [Xenopus laevis]|uniref:Uncharacterized protein n=1 Tax=Xenopus laevis TaxID=8355 RepID=A0A974HSC1_XENLA|nr:hypothetical protein XELAEV_18016758mg [Xenopus laevis]
MAEKAKSFSVTSLNCLWTLALICIYVFLSPVLLGPLKKPTAAACIGLCTQGGPRGLELVVPPMSSLTLVPIYRESRPCVCGGGQTPHCSST